jgi:hypothetical protein
MLKMGNDSIFFETGGYEPETAFTQTYLASLRQHASTWETDVRAEDTHSETIPDQVVVGIPVYGISGLGNHLWLRCAENQGGTPALEGSWGNRFLVADNYGADSRRDLTVHGAQASAEELAKLGARWCEHQLRMDIYRDEWTPKKWVLRDEIGIMLGRRPKRPPVRSILERAGGHAVPATEVRT